MSSATARKTKLAWTHDDDGRWTARGERGVYMVTGIDRTFRVYLRPARHTAFVPLPDSVYTHPAYAIARAEREDLA